MSPKSLSSQFPSLAPHLSTSRLLGLYFGSDWCPDCKPVTPLVCSIYKKQPNNPTKELNILYISSDESSAQMNQHLDSNMIPYQAIPFENAKERSGLKKYFGVCAGKEASLLGMTGGARKFGIPTLVILDCATEKIITMEGVQDIENSRVDPFQIWRL